MPTRQRHQFASDNTAAICPEAWAALAEANREAAASYGEDQWTRRVYDLVQEIFETECATFIVFNGTAANALALAHLCRPFHSILCHERAHIETDECGAPEFFSGGAKLLGIGGENGQTRPRASRRGPGAASRCALDQNPRAQHHPGDRGGNSVFA